MLDLEQIQSLSEFQRNAKRELTKLKKSGKPTVLTVKGKAEAVLLDTKSFKAIQEKLEKLDALMAIKSGLAQIEKGEGRSSEDFFAEMERKHGVSKRK